MQYHLKLWQPAAAAARIYITGGPLDRGDTLYVFAARDALLGKDGWDAKLTSDWRDTHLTNRGLGVRGYEIGLTIAERALAERGWERLGFREIARRLAAGEEPAVEAEQVRAEPIAAAAAANDDGDEEAFRELYAMSPEEVAAALARLK